MWVERRLSILAEQNTEIEWYSKPANAANGTDAAPQYAYAHCAFSGEELLITFLHTFNAWQMLQVFN